MTTEEPATSTSVQTDLKKFGHTAGCRAGSQMSGQEHTAECRKQLEDVMTTDASTATRMKATHVRQTERIINDLGDSGTTNPGSSSGSGQHKRVRFAGQEQLESKPDTEMRTGGRRHP